MISRRYYGIVMSFFLTFFNAITVSIAMVYANTGKFIVEAICISILEATVIALITTLLIPAAPFGVRIAKNKFNAKEGSLKFIIISTVPVCTMMVLVLTFIFALINVGMSSVFFMAWISSIPLAFIVSYITSIIMTPFSERLTNLIIKKDENKLNTNIEK